MSSPPTWPTPPAARSSRSWARRRAASRRSSSSSGSSGPRSRTTRPTALLEDPALDHWRHWLARAAHVPPVPADRAGGEDHHREGRLRRLRLVAALRGAARRASASTSTARTSLALEAAMAKLYSADRDERRGRRRGRHRRARSPGCARARRSSTRSSSTSRSTTGCAATRRGSRRATSRTRRPTTPSQALIDAIVLALRRRPALLPPQGEAARPRPARALRPLRAASPTTRRRRRWDEARGSRRRRLRRLLGRGGRRSSSGSSTRAGSTLRVRPDKRPRRLLRDERPGRPPVRAS